MEENEMGEPGDKSFEHNRNRLENATSYSEVWEIVKDTVNFTMHKRRSGMMLFLDDLPIQLGAYHPVGTNNIVLNRALVNTVEATIQSKQAVNALIYNLLVHEYLHALGELSEAVVRRQVAEICQKIFGESYLATQLALKGPWALLREVPLERFGTSKQAMEIVKNFEKTDKYVV
jgi:hypothetical protein